VYFAWNYNWHFTRAAVYLACAYTNNDYLGEVVDPVTGELKRRQDDIISCGRGHKPALHPLVPAAGGLSVRQPQLQPERLHVQRTPGPVRGAGVFLRTVFRFPFSVKSESLVGRALPAMGFQQPPLQGPQKSGWKKKTARRTR
jgi:hypothetical protein